MDWGRRTLIRLETSANRATLQKLSMMMFQLLFGHECYASHGTWTVFCKVLVRLAYKASALRQKQWRGEEPTDGAYVEPELANTGVKTCGMIVADGSPWV